MLYAVLLISAAISLPSCTTPKSINYFADISDSQLVKLPDIRRPEPVIMPDDMLEIKIEGSNEITSQIFNTYGGMGAAGATAGVPVYTVDRNGEIEFPYIGKVMAAGFTRDEFKSALRAKVSTYLKDAMVNVKFNNFRFTVLGEVRVPGSFVVPTDKVTVLEALGQAGDMTQYAIRDNVRVIRDSSGKREIGKMDFTQKDVFISPFYYLQRNDVIYVETNKNRSKSEQFSRVSALVATFTSIVAIAITVFRK